MNGENDVIQNIVDLIPSSIVISAGNKKRYCNAPFSDLLKSRNLNEQVFLEKLFAHALDVNNPCAMKVGDFTFSVSHKNGVMLNQSVSIFAIQDQTDYAEKMNELLIYKTFMESTNDQGIMICDVNHKVLIYNRPSSAGPYDDTPADIVIGNKYEDVFQHPETSCLLQVLKTGKPIINNKNIYSTPSGKTIVAFGSTYPIKKDGKIIAAAAVIRWNSNIIPLLNNILEFQNQFFCQGKMNNNTQFTFSSIIGNSPAILGAIQKAKKASAFTALPILIYGETGTGKELFAQSIHNASANKSHPFVAVNCAAIPESLLELTLFGSVKGAFTDAKNATGLFEQAGSGTIFLDEINSMPISLQSKILRVIQEKTFRKLGSSEEVAVNCRIIASMNKPPLDCIANHTLREDLYYRISAITIDVPPLCERKEDIEILAKYFIQKYSSTYEVAPIVMPEKYLDMLKVHSWPGNVRELQNTIESSLVMLEPESVVLPSPNILPNQIVNIDPASFHSEEIHGLSRNHDNDLNLKYALSSAERDIIVEGLNENAWNISKTAKAIGISRSNLQYRIEKLGLTPESGKN